MRIEIIQQRLRNYHPVAVEGAAYRRAAVAVIFRDGADGAEFVVIHRAHRRGDPWSGHMALPGGRQDAADPDLFATVIRETREEIGVDLAAHGELLGHLDDLQAMIRGRPLDLIVTPFVWTMKAPVVVTPNEREVQSAFWVPLLCLRRPDARSTYRRSIGGGQHLEHPAFVYEGHMIWGLTHRILTRLMEVLS